MRVTVHDRDTVATSSPTLPVDAQSHRCPRCLGVEIDHSPRETWCRSCGFVLDESPTDFGPEWRSFADDETNPERAAPGDPNRADRGLGSTRRSKATDPSGSRKDKWHIRAARGSRKDRNRDWVTQEIRRMASALSLPDHVTDRAAWLFRRIHEETLEGRDLDAVGAACLYAVCRENGMGRTPDEIATVARCGERRIRRRVWWVADELGLELPPPDVRQRIRVVASKLPDDSEAVERAVSRFDELDGAQVANGSPSTLAAWLLWEAGAWNQTDVAEAAGVTATGLRKRRDNLSEVNA
jgi:transcription initiation factor TFIIB